MLTTLIAAAIWIPNLIFEPTTGHLLLVGMNTKLCAESTQIGTHMVAVFHENEEGDILGHTCHDVPDVILYRLPLVDLMPDSPTSEDIDKQILPQSK